MIQILECIRYQYLSINSKPVEPVGQDTISLVMQLQLLKMVPKSRRFIITMYLVIPSLFFQNLETKQH